MGTVTILPETTKQPISMIGQMAGVCWGADTTDEGRNYKRGIDCLESGHGRTFEFPDVYMILDGYSARVMREWYTHIGGMPTRLQASTRYIDYCNFDYVVPPSIEQNENALARYHEAMGAISWALRNMTDIPREDAALLLPLGMTTRVVCKHNLRNLIDMSRQRMCNRAYWEYRELFEDICCALKQYGLDKDSHEWETVVDAQFQPKCEMLGYCPEKHGCGIMPKKG
jgi:thymidylate synthase (FAD)